MFSLVSKSSRRLIPSISSSSLPSSSYYFSTLKPKENNEINVENENDKQSNENNEQINVINQDHSNVSTNSVFSFPKLEKKFDDQDASKAYYSLEGHEKEVVYLAGQGKTIRTMAMASSVNFFIWGSVLTNHYFLGSQGFGSVIAANPMWGWVGLGFTGILGYLTRNLTFQSVYQIYIVKKTKKIGFINHNIFGFPHNKYEFPFQDVSFVDVKELNEAKSKLSNGYVAIHAKGFPRNLLVEQEIINSKECQKFKDLLLQRDLSLIMDINPNDNNNKENYYIKKKSKKNH